MELRRMTLILIVAAAVGTGLALFAPVPARANPLPITFTFDSCSEAGLPSTCQNASTGTSSLTYTVGGLSLKATGWQLTPTSATDLYIKNAGSGETGLGITKEINHEISDAYLINFDMGNLLTSGITSGLLTVQSVQSGEGFEVCTGTTSGHLGSVGCHTYTDPPGGVIQTVPVSFSTTDPFIGITGYVPWGGNPKADVLLSTLVVSPVPEPASLLLTGTGLVGLFGALRRRVRI